MSEPLLYVATALVAVAAFAVAAAMLYVAFKPGLHRPRLRGDDHRAQDPYVRRRRRRSQGIRMDRRPRSARQDVPHEPV